jgi:hypothetical protein
MAGGAASLAARRVLLLRRPGLHFSGQASSDQAVADARIR